MVYFLHNNINNRFSQAKVRINEHNTNKSIIICFYSCVPLAQAKHLTIDYAFRVAMYFRHLIRRGHSRACFFVFVRRFGQQIHVFIVKSLPKRKTFCRKNIVVLTIICIFVRVIFSMYLLTLNHYD